MGIIIEDGLGSGKSVGVDQQNRFLVKATTLDELASGTFSGQSYDADPGTTTLTSSGESGILYVKNTDPNNLLQFYGLAISIGKSNTTGDVILKSYTNPNGGTLISAGTTVTPINRNIGMNTPALATVFGGAEGKTITGGTSLATFIFQTPQFFIVDLSTILPNGYSIALSLTPPSGNTSVKVNLTVRFVYLNPPV